MRGRLKGEELRVAVAGLPAWKLDRGGLLRTVSFADFASAIRFVNRAAALAESANHHPDIDIRFNKIRMFLTTHSAGGITRMDIEMAARLDEEMQEMEDRLQK